MATKRSIDAMASSQKTPIESDSCSKKAKAQIEASAAPARNAKAPAQGSDMANTNPHTSRLRLARILGRTLSKAI